MSDGTKEDQYNRLLAVRDDHGLEPLGLMMNQAWYDDPKRLAFTFARYKFVAKMLDGFESVLEVGCGDAFPSRIVRQHIQSLSVTDFDPVFIDDIKARQIDRWAYHRIFLHDMLSGAPEGTYDGMYALDVLEHIAPANEDRFLANMAASLRPNGTMIIGMPSLESQPYASPLSKAGHVNCKSQAALRETMLRHFTNVYMFSMNDELLHVGFAPMSQYLLALCTGKRS